KSMRHAHWQRNARALAAGNVLINIGWNASFAFLPLIIASLGVERNLALWVGAMMFGYHAVSCMFTPVWGVLADHYGRKSMVLRAAFGMAGGFGVLSITSDPLLCLQVRRWWRPPRRANTWAARLRSPRPARRAVCCSARLPVPRWSPGSRPVS